MSTFVFERTPKWTMCVCASDKVWCSVCTYCGRHIQKADLSRFVCPWCVFHVCWKDKHSCTLMTLKCFWDSECMCMCVCVYMCACVLFFAFDHFSEKPIGATLVLYNYPLRQPHSSTENSLPPRIFLYLCVRVCACVCVYVNIYADQIEFETLRWGHIWKVWTFWLILTFWHVFKRFFEG